MDASVCNVRASGEYFHFNCILQEKPLIANNADPDQTPPRIAASEPGLQCLHMCPERGSANNVWHCRTEVRSTQTLHYIRMMGVYDLGRCLLCPMSDIVNALSV